MTMTDIICPICNRVNESSAERCWYCQAILVKDQPTETENDPGENNEKAHAGSVRKSEPAPDSGKNGEIPDWLARIRRLEKEEREQSEGINPFLEGESSKDDIPDWLNEFRLEGDPGSEAIRQQPQKELPPENVPPLSSFEDLTEQLPIDSNEEPLDAFDSLLAELGIGAANAVQEEPTSEVFDEKTVTGSDQVGSDYLERLSFSERIESEDQSDQSESASVVPDKTSDFSEATIVTPEFPWEGEMETPSIEPQEQVIEPEPEIEVEPISQPVSNTESVDEPGFTFETEPEPMPDTELDRDEESRGELPTLDSSGIIPPNTGEPRSVSFDDDDLPEWLSLDDHESVKKPDSHKIESIPEIELDASKLERAHLPAWLHAIRPVEAVTPLKPASKSSSENEKPAEEGILAGIEGVLRSADLSDQIKKPSLYSSGIEVSERQQQNVALFKTLLEGAEPEKVTGVSPKIPIRSNFILRIVVTLALLAAVLLPIFSYTPFRITPVLFPTEVVNTFGEIQNLQSGKPVLLAAHFEAGLAGEMKWTSRAVIEHLMTRNIPMTVISTNAIGYAILEEEIRDSSQTVTGYLVDDQVVNLGYLPGGTLGILSLTRNLHQALPYTTNIQPAWDQPRLQGINNLSDFGAVIVFTDNADIVKTWVEQAGTSMNVPPMLAVVSAQAAPMTQPYYDSGQIKGFVAGMNGSQAYEQIMQKSYDSTLAFGSFQFTLLVTALIIFLGGAVSLVISSGTGMKKGGGK